MLLIKQTRTIMSYVVYPFIQAICDSKAWDLAWLPKCQGTVCMTYIQNSYTALLHSIMAGRINYRNYKCHNKLKFFCLSCISNVIC